MRFLFLILPFALVFQRLEAQDTLVFGIVLEEDFKGNLSPLPGVHVVWMGTSSGTTTDSLGYFQLQMSTSSKMLVFSYVGFQSDTLLIENNSKLKVILKSGSSLKEIGIEYRKKSTEISSLDMIKTQWMTEKELFKAACCNLSESFETNPSVDVAFSDAVTGTRQLQMLGLSGPYIQISREAMPGIRGLYGVSGFGFIPGTWLKGIQVSKGTGSVVNGFESMSGQINLEMKKPEGDDLLYINGYLNESGRMETNIVSSLPISDRWSTALLVHGSQRPFEVDQNEDEFLDLPRGGQYSLMNRYQYRNAVTGIEADMGLFLLKDQRIAGQKGFESGDAWRPQPRFGADLSSEHGEIWTKIGYIFPQSRYKSIGLQLSGVRHRRWSELGRRNYQGAQNSTYANLIYQSVLGTTDHTLRTGVSMQSDQFDEVLDSLSFGRREYISGAFLEYSYQGGSNWGLIAGIRSDYHSLFGLFFTPRVHLRWNLQPTTVVRLTVGRGQRSANLIVENEGLLLTSRNWILESQNTQQGIYGFQPEVSWNLGGSITHQFKLNYREGYVGFEAFHTRFTNQVVVDTDISPTAVHFYALQGLSYSTAWQADAEYEIAKRLDVRLAFRYFDVQTDFKEGRREKALVARSRAFANIAWEDRKRKWQIDLTIQWIGSKRLPITTSSPVEFQLEARSPSYVLMNAQVSRVFSKKMEAYIGVENLNNFTQTDPIVSFADPFGPFFDSSIVWGPIFGRMVYAGFRFRIKHSKSN